LIAVLKVLQGDCIEMMRTMPAESVQCVVTSPPYWGLRDYGHAGQLGAEKTPSLYVSKMVSVFEEIRRVLKKDGTVWLNIGDSYAGSWGAQGRTNGGSSYNNSKISSDQIDAAPRKTTNTGTIREAGLKPKDLIGMPWRVAFALQTAGWYIRSDIIWNKPNPMTESVRDRPTCAHEHIFLLSKSRHYYYDAAAIAEKSTPGAGRDTTTSRRQSPPGKPTDRGFKKGRQFKTRNKRNVWTISVGRFAGAHFATFPCALIKPCVLAGSRAGDVVFDPFGGSGTTGKVALELGRKAILCELNPDYIKIIHERTAVNIGLGI
jgi:DNA modification methylase